MQHQNDLVLIIFIIRFWMAFEKQRWADSFILDLSLSSVCGMSPMPLNAFNSNWNWNYPQITQHKYAVIIRSYVCGIPYFKFNGIGDIPHTELRLRSRMKESAQRCFSNAIQNLMINIIRTRSFWCCIIWSTTCLSSLVDKWFNRRLVFWWVRIVLCYSLIWIYTLMRQISFKSKC
jgi:hypothetical protein